MIVAISGVINDGATAQIYQTQQPLSVPPGEYVQLNITVSETDSEPVDITGAAIIFTVRQTVDSEDYEISRAGTIVSGASGTATVVLQEADTIDLTPGAYVYDIWVTDADDNSNCIVPASRFTVLNAITHLGDPVSSPGPDMLLVGVPVPATADVGGCLVVTDEDPVTLDWTHVEEGIAVFNEAQDYIDVTFTTAFAAATGASGYRFSLGVYVSDSGGEIAATITSKTTTGMRIAPSNPFTGEIAWRAWK